MAEQIQEITSLEAKLDNFLEEEEIFWRQRSHVSWLKEGDQITKYFHAHRSQQRRNNCTLGLEDENGNWLDKVKTVELHVVNYFFDLF